MTPRGTSRRLSRTSTASQVAELAATVVVLVAVTAAGTTLFSIAAEGRYAFSDLLVRVGLPAAVILALLTGVAYRGGWHRLRRGVTVGFWTGFVTTVVLEAIRIGGLRLFDSVPGDLPRLIGVQAIGRSVLQGATPLSDVVGWGLYFWSGAMFGITYVLLFGGWPRRGWPWAGAALGGVYGVAWSVRFLTSQVPVMLGVGTFGTIFGPVLATTVILAHVGFGAALGVLVQRFAADVDPVWVPVRRLFNRAGGRGGPTGGSGPMPELVHR